jgi:hypothetical protein
LLLFTDIAVAVQMPPTTFEHCYFKSEKTYVEERERERERELL